MNPECDSDCPFCELERKEYYNSKSKKDSELIACWCIAGIFIILFIIAFFGRR